MNKLTAEHLESLLKKLQMEYGSFSITSGNYYCNFIKEDEKIEFRAASHFSNNKIPINAMVDFYTIGFNLQQGEDYRKSILIRNISDIIAITDTVKNVFSNIYKLNNATYEFLDNIIPKGNEVKKGTKQNSGFKPAFVVLILLIAALAIFIFLLSNNKQTNKLQINSDGLVEQVKTYLKEHLKDAKSYEPVKWVQYMTIFDTNLHPLYQIGHRYRSKNSFGAYVIEDKLFSIDDFGKVVDVYDVDLDELQKINPKNLAPIQ